MVNDVSKFNRQSPREEIANAISHGLGTLLAIAGTPVLIVYAALHGDALSVVSASLYGASMILLYLFSTLYHSITNKSGKRVLQVFDHCSIFILILGTYIPVTLGLIRGWLGWTLFGINAAVALIGIVLNAVSVQKFHKFSLLLYLLSGWSVLPAIKPLLSLITPGGFALVLAGGLFYTVGVWFYRREEVRYMHLVWHLFVLAGSICHYFFVLFYCLG
jgi:hemolysin III